MKIQKGAHIKDFSPDQRNKAIFAAFVVLLVVIILFAFGKTTGSDVGKKTTEPESKQSEEVTTPEETTDPDGDVEIGSNTDDYSVDSSIIIQGDRAMEIFSVSSTSLTRYGQNINNFAKRIPNRNVYVLLAPTSLEFYGPDDYKTDNHSQLKAMNLVYEQLTADNVKTVDARNAIAKHVDEYIYLRTDHHWTARGAYYAYAAFCQVSDQTATTLESHQTGKIEGFVGSMYRYTEAAALKNNPDYVEYFIPNHTTVGKTYTDGAMSGEGRTIQAVNTSVSGSNGYLCFIEGDNAVDKFTTNVGNGKSIVLIKESFGNAFAPFLMDNYDTVYVIDPRKVDLDLQSFVETNDIDDVLFLNYTMAPSNPTYKAAFYKMIGASE